ncbi:hypothetical protein [Thermococcus pacificus]|uniref:hypothetical protein n=1 Tax=Thermococcus pacificus TaxID=71998 RepID=UPI0018DF4FA7|nr:hypothetical protein [Thermococcus pacificus]
MVVLVSEEVVSAAVVLEVVVVGVDSVEAADVVGVVLWGTPAVPLGSEVVFSDCDGEVVTEAPPFPRQPAENTIIPASIRARSLVK